MSTINDPLPVCAPDLLVNGSLTHDSHNFVLPRLASKRFVKPAGRLGNTDMVADLRENCEFAGDVNAP